MHRDRKEKKVKKEIHLYNNNNNNTIAHHLYLSLLLGSQSFNSR